MARSSRLRRAWRWPLYALLAVLLLAALPLLALQTSFAREQIRTRVNVVLADVLEGRIQIERLASVSLSGVSGVDARVFDPKGRQVIRAQGLRAEASLLDIAWQFLAHGSSPALRISAVHVDHADVTLREDEELGVTLARTFLPKPSPTAEPPSQAPFDLSLYLPRVEVARVWAHGRAQGSPPLDAELTRLMAELSLTPRAGFDLQLKSAELTTRSLPLGADPRGNVSGSVEVGPESAPRLELTLAGQAAGSPLALDAAWQGDELHARVELARLPSALLNQQTGLQMDGDVTLVAEAEGPLPQLDFDAELDATAAHATLSGYVLVEQGLELGAVLRARSVDVSRISATAPNSDLDVEARVLAFEGAEGEVYGSHRVDVGAGTVAGQATPALWLTGRDDVSEQQLQSRGKWGATEPGIDLNGAYRVALPQTGDGVVSVETAARLEQPRRLAQTGLKVWGTARLAAELHTGSQALRGKAQVSLRRLEVPRVQARQLELEATASGTLSEPRVHAATSLELLSGRVHADVDYTPKRQQIELFAADLNLLRLAAMLGTPLPLRQAMLGLDVRAEHTKNWRLDGTASVDCGTLGSVRAHARDFELTASRRPKLEGELGVTGQLDLAQLSPLWTGSKLPIERTTGRVRFEATAKPEPMADGELELALAVDTTGLRVVGQRGNEDPTSEPKTTSDAIQAQPLALEGIDLHLSARLRPESGEAVGTLILRDPGGTLAELQARVEVPRPLPERLADVAAWRRAPLQLWLQSPERRLQSLPASLRPAALRGRSSLDARLSGSIAEPRLQAAAQLVRLRSSGTHDPVDVSLEVEAALEGGKLSVAASQSGHSAKLLELETAWRGDLQRAAASSFQAGGLTADFEAKLHDFPLAVVPELVDRQIEGKLSGTVTLRDWGKDAQLSADLSSTSLTLGNVAVRELSAKAHTVADQLQAELRAAVGSGTARATLRTGLRWGTRAVPDLDRHGDAQVEARAFQLESLSPLLGAYISELGGTLDANGQLHATAAGTKLSGAATLQRGVVQVPALGQRFSDISAKISVVGDELKLEKLDARGTTGRMAVKGAARLDGFDVANAHAELVIKEREAMPITIEGAVLGDAWGNIDAKYASPASGERTLSIDVPRFHLLTPESSGHGLQSLDANPSIRVGARRADGVLVPLAVQPLEPGPASSGEAGAARPLRIEVKLGSDVSVERERTATAQLSGKLVILTAPQTDVSGRIELRGGKLDVQGKTFEIERGVITFEGSEPDNPTITATARWDAPGYTLYAEYLGDVKNGRIKLRAEPPLTQDEIASLLLFGTTEGMGAGSSDPNAAALAVGVAGGTATQGLNQVLDDFTHLDVSTRIDTTTGSARPELVFRVSPRVSAKVTRAIGAPAAGESPDRTFLTLELRLRRAWALSALLGDHGASALDLIWRRRY